MNGGQLVFTGLKTSITTGFVATIRTKFLGASQRLGYMATSTTTFLRILDVYAPLAARSLVATLVFVLLETLDRKLGFWRVDLEARRRDHRQPPVRLAGMTETLLLPEWARDAVSRLDVEALSEQVVDVSMRYAFADHADDRQLEQLLASSVFENVTSLRSYLTGGVSLSQIVPIRPVALAVVQAQLEISETAIQRAYRVGASVILGNWVVTVREAVAASSLSPLEALDAVNAVVEAFFECQDHIVAAVANAHAAEQGKLRLSKVQLRRKILRSHLCGESMLNEQELAEALQYPVGEIHLAVLLAASPEQEAKEVATALRGRVAASASLVHQLGVATTALWLSKASPWSARAIDSVLRGLRASGVPASVSTPRTGAEGLRISLEETRNVETVRAARGGDAPDVIAFPDVKLEVLALADSGAARRFVEEELKGLAEDSKTAAVLRETLLVWFAAGSHVSAAAQLRLHEHTIRNRLRRAEELVGHPLTMRRTEMQVALRLYRVVGLGSGSSRGDASIMKSDGPSGSEPSRRRGARTPEAGRSTRSAQRR